MINHWFAVEKKHDNLNAFTHLEPYLDGDVYKIRGHLMFPVSIDGNSSTFRYKDFMTQYRAEWIQLN